MKSKLKFIKILKLFAGSFKYEIRTTYTWNMHGISKKNKLTNNFRYFPYNLIPLYQVFSTLFAKSPHRYATLFAAEQLQRFQPLCRAYMPAASEIRWWPKKKKCAAVKKPIEGAVRGEYDYNGSSSSQGQTARQTAKRF